MAPNEIYAAINRVFANSRLGNGGDEDDKFTISAPGQKSKYSIKLTQRIPIFLLKISCPPHTCDLLLDPSKNMVEFQNWDLVIGIVQDLARNFLIDSSLYDDVTDADSLTGERSEVDESDADSGATTADVVASPSSPEPSSGSRRLLLPAAESGIDNTTGYLSHDSVTAAETITTTTSGNRYALWQDQARHSYFIDQRSGNSYRQLPGEPPRDKEPTTTMTTTTMTTRRSANPVDTRRLRGKTLDRRAPGDGSAAQFHNLKFDDELKKWKNPVFKRAEKAIPGGGRRETLQQPRSFAERARRLFARGGGGGGGDGDGDGDGEQAVAGSLSKTQLGAMRVLAQVDDKFILCAVPTETTTTPGSSGELLVMVDQHAADERVQLEVLLDELYQRRDDKSTGAGNDDDDTDDNDDINRDDEAAGRAARRVDSVRLEPACRIMMDAREAHAAVRHAARFARWGLVFTSPDIPPPASSSSSSSITVNPDTALRIDVTHLPRLIADRCVVDPGVTKDVLRQHVFFLQGGTTDDGKCPKGILDILHSKACRSAIMFGTTLTVEQCEALINRLKLCKPHTNPVKDAAAAAAAVVVIAV
ncbi:DNA mismatch repair protein [Geranomyces michiganensis]|nr:DNA mismatch repair protein [Geranomyces michiganensis]